MIPNAKLKRMRAYHNDALLKKDMVSEVMRHQRADMIIKGTYGEENGIWRGCAVGCSIHSYNLKRNKTIKTSDHNAYERVLGIPESLARLEDYLFETMSDDKALKFPAEFLRAIPVGADLSLVAPNDHINGIMARNTKFGLIDIFINTKHLRDIILPSKILDWWS